MGNERKEDCYTLLVKSVTMQKVHGKAEIWSQKQEVPKKNKKMMVQQLG
jgi:hypothetical protein